MIPPKRIRAWEGNLRPARGRIIRVGEGPSSMGEGVTVERGPVVADQPAGEAGATAGKVGVGVLVGLEVEVGLLAI